MQNITIISNLALIINWMINLSKLTLLACLIALAYSALLSQKGAGISDEQEVLIIQIARNAVEKYRYSLTSVALVLASDMYTINFESRRQWNVQVFTGADVTDARVGIKIHNDSWIRFQLEDLNAWFWVWKPFQLPALNQPILNHNNLEFKGEGISEGQQTMILNFIRNAELSKGGDMYGNAVTIKEKLDDAFGQDWVVQIVGGENLKFGRSHIWFMDEQWITLPYQGDHHWTYMIWVAQYW